MIVVVILQVVLQVRVVVVLEVSTASATAVKTPSLMLTLLVVHRHHCSELNASGKLAILLA